MSFAIARLDALTTATSHLIGVGLAIAAQSEVVSAPAISLPPPVADELLAWPATVFSAWPVACQAATAQPMTARELFTSALGVSAGSNAATEPANPIAVSYRGGDR